MVLAAVRNGRAHIVHTDAAIRLTPYQQVEQWTRTAFGRDSLVKLERHPASGIGPGQRIQPGVGCLWSRLAEYVGYGNEPTLHFWCTFPPLSG